MSKIIHYNSPTGTIILRQGLERLAYLQGDGTAYIDTGTKLNYSSVNNIRVICTNDFEDKRAAPFIGTNSFLTGFMALYHYSNNIIYDLYITGDCHYGYNIPVGNKINFYMLLDYKNLKYSYWLNSSKDINRTITKGTDSGNIYFFRGSINHYSATKCKCYEVSINIDGGDLKYFIPVRVKSDVTIAGTSYSAGTLGMYDYNNDKLYTNAASSGEFIAGPECPQGFPTLEYCLVEWLEFKPKVLYNTGFTIALNSTVITEIGIRYKEGENTRDLWGYTDNTGLGYLGVNTSSIWERGTASQPDITKYTTLIYTHKAGEYTGIYSLGGINNKDTFSTRTKYISLLKLTINNVLSADYVACYRRSDMMSGFYDLVSRTFKEIPNVSLGPSITFGWGEVMNGASDNLRAVPHNISSGEGRFGINTAFDFSSTNAYLNTNGLTTGKTYMGWFYTVSKPLREVFFADDASGIAFGIYDKGTKAVIATDNSPKTVFTLSTWNTGWNHIAVVKANNGPLLYINGIAQTATSSINGWAHSGGLWIGARSTFGSNFSGRCQDFKVLDTALTLAQIQQEM